MMSRQNPGKIQRIPGRQFHRFDINHRIAVIKGFHLILSSDVTDRCIGEDSPDQSNQEISHGNLPALLQSHDIVYHQKKSLNITCYLKDDRILAVFEVLNANYCKCSAPAKHNAPGA